jgi:hypothetical protein
MILHGSLSGGFSDVLSLDEQLDEFLRGFLSGCCVDLLSKCYFGLDSPLVFSSYVYDDIAYSFHTENLFIFIFCQRK